MVSVYDTDFIYRHFEMLRNKFEDSSICHIAFCFFADGNREVISR